MFTTADCSTEILVFLYEFVYGKEHLQKAKVIEYPIINKATHKILFLKFIKLDREKSPNVFSGGAWMNKGFSEARPGNGHDDLKDWEAEITV
ncbi:hypothetical protein ACFL35_16850 [Candidatus Riflebacteria bacterium]